MKRLFIIALISLWRAPAGAAPCCGSAARMPSLLTGDDRLQLSTTFALGSVSGEAADNGRIRPRASSETDLSQRLSVSAATLFSDRLQGGVSVPLIRRIRGRGQTNNSAIGIGDASATIGYEALPEFIFSPWRPKAFVFFSITAPTGTSEYETAEILKVDVRGRGFWNMAVGTHLSKRLRWVDLILISDLHRSLARTVTPIALDEDYRLTPGFGTQVLAELGLRPSRLPLRLSLSLSHNFEESISAAGIVNSVYASQSFWTASVAASYALSPEWTVAIDYQDQAIFGTAHNVALAKTAVLSLHKVWQR